MIRAEAGTGARPVKVPHPLRSGEGVRRPLPPEPEHQASGRPGGANKVRARYGVPSPIPLQYERAMECVVETSFHALHGSGDVAGVDAGDHFRAEPAFPPSHGVASLATNIKTGPSSSWSIRSRCSSVRVLPANQCMATSARCAWRDRAGRLLPSSVPGTAELRAVLCVLSRQPRVICQSFQHLIWYNLAHIRLVRLMTNRPFLLVATPARSVRYARGR